MHSGDMTSRSSNFSLLRHTERCKIDAVYVGDYQLRLAARMITITIMMMMMMKMMMMRQPMLLSELAARLSSENFSYKIWKRKKSLSRSRRH